MMRIGRVLRVNTYGFELQEADPSAVGRLRAGSKIYLAVDPEGQRFRHGEFDLEMADSAGMVVWQPIRAVIPDAADGDYLFTPDPSPAWTPYA